ncbi:uncharacterized protein LOC143363603 [Halictus rubicundus]|uniref:uncharacterized protein LOC143363603 n=1 Tax=Halictus rubicundus TaxID=77578 RepID=UPI004035C85C
MSSLTGRALECLGNLPVTADNFDIAWKALTARYENPRRLISSHLTSMLDLPALSRESASDLQNLRDRVSVIVASLKNLGRAPADLWNDFLVHIVSQKLDAPTRKAWKIKTGDDVQPPTFDALTKFIDSRVRALEEFAPSAPASSSAFPVASSQTSAGRSHVHVATVSQSDKNSKSSCPVCRASHMLSSCPKFNARSPRDRRDLVHRFSRCVNCLSLKHLVRDCPSKYTCRVCHQRHHSLLHDTEALPASPSPAPTPLPEVKSHLASTPTEPGSAVLLATAWVRIHAPSGHSIPVRALIDQGSEASFLTEAMVSLLLAKRIRVETSISAVGGVHAGRVRHAVRLRVSPRSSATPAISTVALVLPSLSTYTPKRLLDSRSLAHSSSLNWADPDPFSSSAIHLILGADVYADIILDGVRKGPRGHPIAQNSIFGWIVSGPCSRPSRDAVRSRASPHAASSLSMHHCIQEDPLSHELTRFWEIEEIPRRTLLTTDEEQCEAHFRANTTRTADGRYVVRLPFRDGPPIKIGHSYSVAAKVSRSLHRKLSLKPSLALEYRTFLREYEEMGRMRRALSSALTSPQCVYIPHHPVLREGSSTTHLRVVFNVSSITSDGTSLNDHLFPGLKLQADLPSVILRWRHFRYVYTADIAKMYRQILIDPRDIDYRRILWQESPADAPIPFQLLTVTYGMTCAPFLALRVLQRLVEDEGSRFPLAVPILRSNIYVDDVLFGANDVSPLLQSRGQLNNLLQCAHMTLRKWASNHCGLLEDIDPSDHGLACSKILAPDDHVKVLGISWNPSRDSFQFNASFSESLPSTKRTILSTIAKLYDPLGWVTPAIIRAKILIQDLWRLRLGWDDQISDPLLERWTAIYTRLPLLSGVQLSRWTGHSPPDSHMEIHGFADASTVAYAAVVYARCISADGRVTVSFSPASPRSRLSPL